MIDYATIDDLEDVYQLICILENKQINKEHFIQTYQRALEDKDTIYMVYRDNQIKGFISFVVHHYLHHDQDMGEIVELVVDPKYRSQKIGEKLIYRIEGEARKRGLEQIELSTSTYRKDAHRFYETHGYEMNHYNYTKNL